MRRKNTLITVIFSVLIMLGTHAAANNESIWTITPEPAWGSQAELQKTDQNVRNKKRRGKMYLVAESHDIYSDNARNTIYYQRFAYRINNASGLDSSDPISIEFDPLYQRVEFHQARIHRDGTTIDQLLQGDKVQQLQRETQLDEGLYDGHETLHLILDDQRVGDIIEYSYSIIGANPVYDNHIFGWSRLQAGVTVGNYYFRLQYPEHKAVNTKLYSGTVPMEKITTDGYHQLTWQNLNTTPTDYQSNVPSHLLATTYVQYSDFADWQEVAEWAAPLYTLPEEASLQIKDKAESIKATQFGQKAQIEEAIRFVQDEVRYTGINSGIGGFVPDLPASILQRRFGDCKDKSILITALLREFGITATPSLVHSYNGPALKSYLPSPDAFNHMIVGIPFKGTTYWIDGTMTLQGNTLESIEQGAYVAALVPAQAESGLQQYKPRQIFKSKKVVEEAYTLADNNDDKKTTLTIRTRLHGSEAERMRHTLQRRGLAGLEEQYLDYYNEEFGNVEVSAEMTAEDDLRTNIITLSESYLIDDVWQIDDDSEKERFILDLNMEDIYHAIKMPDDKRRFQPIAQRHPTNIYYKVTVLDDDGWDLDNQKLSINNKYFKYRSRVTTSGNELTLTYRVETKADTISVADSKSYIKNLRAMLSDVGFQLFYTPVESPLSLINNWVESAQQFSQQSVSGNVNQD